MVILVLEALQHSPIIFFHLHAYLFGLKFITLESEQPKRRG